MHWRKSMGFFSEDTRITKSIFCIFDIIRVSFDGALICDIGHVYLVFKLMDLLHTEIRGNYLMILYPVMKKV